MWNIIPIMGDTEAEPTEHSVGGGDRGLGEAGALEVVVVHRSI